MIKKENQKEADKSSLKENQETKNSDIQTVMNLDNSLCIVGTSHIAKQSIKKIREIYNVFQPEIIAIELDKQRLDSLLSGQKQRISLKSVATVGFSGFILAIVASFVQKKLGKIVGMDPGVDMLEGVKLAKHNNLPLALIDQNINITLRRFSQTFGFKEKIKFVYYIISSFFKKSSEDKQFLQKHKTINLKKIPEKELVRYMILKLKKDFPALYKVLINERDHYMSKKIINILKTHPHKKVMVIIGAGHEESVRQLVYKAHKLE